jgi:NDP-sugar pyrophosphorylase family protein
MQDLSQITTVILAGGRGVRLQSAVPDRPKVLADVLQRPFLTYLLDQIVSAKGHRVVLCTGFMADIIQERLGEVYRTLTLLYSKEIKPLGTGGAVREALPLIQSDPCLIMNGDSYVNLDLSDYLRWFAKKKRRVSILVTKVADPSRYGSVSLDEDQRVVAFQEKTTHGGSRWINAGIYIATKDVLLTIPEHVPYSLEKQLLPALIYKDLYGYQTGGEFIDIGTPASYARAERFFDRVHKSLSVGDPP